MNKSPGHVDDAPNARNAYIAVVAPFEFRIFPWKGPFDYPLTKADGGFIKCACTVDAFCIPKIICPAGAHGQTFCSVMLMKDKTSMLFRALFLTFPFMKQSFVRTCQRDLSKKTQTKPVYGSTPKFCWINIFCLIVSGTYQTSTESRC